MRPMANKQLIQRRTAGVLKHQAHNAVVVASARLVAPPSQRQAHP